MQRLLAEEGIYVWFAHAGDAGSERLGSHTLVLSDHNHAFAALGTVRYHRTVPSSAKAWLWSDSTRVWLPRRSLPASPACANQT
ncbi:contractile injection system protein, VgrG/Pvc8 family [Xanthomonas fragariae]|uniref:contractile injection system protein, VgrG/Pvc8 family n=1 Tax=Xanthomonas fragariae TaxID=48664 RepID=UPI003CCE677E